MREALEGLIQKVVARYSGDHQVPLPEDFYPEVVVTRDPTHGDFASNAAFKLAKPARKKPFFPLNPYPWVFGCRCPSEPPFILFFRILALLFQALSHKTSANLIAKNRSAQVKVCRVKHF